MRLWVSSLMRITIKRMLTTHWQRLSSSYCPKCQPWRVNWKEGSRNLILRMKVSDLSRQTERSNLRRPSTVNRPQVDNVHDQHIHTKWYSILSIQVNLFRCLMKRLFISVGMSIVTVYWVRMRFQGKSVQCLWLNIIMIRSSISRLEFVERISILNILFYNITVGHFVLVEPYWTMVWEKRTTQTC